MSQEQIESPPWQRPFYVADLNVRGEVKAIAEYLYQHLEQIPGAAELIGHLSAQLWRSPGGFETLLPMCREPMKFRFTATADTAGISTLRIGQQLGSLGLLATGLDRDADHLTFQAFQLHLVRELHDTEFEPAFALMDLKQRPLTAIIGFAEPADQNDQLVLALADRCFAAAYFRYHALS